MIAQCTDCENYTCHSWIYSSVRRAWRFPLVLFCYVATWIESQHDCETSAHPHLLRSEATWGRRNSHRLRWVSIILHCGPSMMYRHPGPLVPNDLKHVMSRFGCSYPPSVRRGSQQQPPIRLHNSIRQPASDIRALRVDNMYDSNNSWMGGRVDQLKPKHANCGSATSDGATHWL